MAQIGVSSVKEISRGSGTLMKKARRRKKRGIERREGHTCIPGSLL